MNSESSTAAATTAAPISSVQRQQGKARLHHRLQMWTWIFGILATISFVANIGLGGVNITPAEIISAISQMIAGDDIPGTDQATLIIAHIRLPRTIGVLLVGAVLGVCGAMLQGLFRNPLADPGLVGVSAGAAFTAVLTIVFVHKIAGLVDPAFLRFVLPAAAFFGGFACTLLIYRISLHQGRARVATMLLAGIAINAIGMALVGALIYISDDQQMRELLFWQMGSFGGLTWSLLLPGIPFLLVPLFIACRLARPLNALTLGENDAGNLGFNITRVTRQVVLSVAIGVGAAVAISGIIGFAGLVVPHLVRLISGVDHRSLLLQSMLLGSTLLLCADLVARTVAVPAELPIGLVTSLFGGPFFLWLLISRKRRVIG